MSTIKLDQAIYWVGDASEERSAKALRANLAARRELSPDQIPLTEFKSDGSTEGALPKDIILLAHTNPERTTIGDQTPDELAETLAKQFKSAKRDKSQLESITLISCEAGVGDKPLALQLAEALHRKGFINVQVKAATHPKTPNPKGSEIGGFVQVVTQAGLTFLEGRRDGQVQAVMYGNQKTADYLRWKTLHTMRGSTKTPPAGWSTALEQEMTDLAEKHRNFRLFDENHPYFCRITLVNDIDDLDAPHNTFGSQGAVATLNLDAAIAWDVLRVERQRYAAYGKNKSTIAYIDAYIAAIKENPALDQDSISKKVPSEISKKAPVANIAAIQQTIRYEISRKTKAMDPNQPFSLVDTIASKIEKETDYLARLLKKDGLADRFLQSIFGTSEFTQNLRKLTKHLSTQTLIAKAEREDIKLSILTQEKIDSAVEAERSRSNSSWTTRLSQVGSSMLLAARGSTATVSQHTSPLKALYDGLRVYSAKPNPTATDWENDVAGRYATFNRSEQSKKCSDLKKLVAALEANNTTLAGIHTQLQEIRDILAATIQSYLEEHNKNGQPDKTHKPKVAVMKAMKAYVENPSEATWKNLDQSTEANKGWDKGLFSKVKHMMNETRKAYDAQKAMTKQAIEAGQENAALKEADPAELSAIFGA